MKYIFVLILILLISTSCSKGPQNGNAPSNKNNDQVHVKQAKQNKPKITDANAVAAHLENLAMRIPQVKSANCVVFGNTAVVGLNIDAKLDRSRVGIVKYSVAEALKKDPYGAYAIITADMDLNQRLRSIRDKIKQGKPIQGFASEMGQIISRIIPQIPINI